MSPSNLTHAANQSILPHAFFFNTFADSKPIMGYVRKYSALILLVLFGCYYSGISMFSHVHIVNGSSVVHSHLGGTSEHSHSDSQYAVIDILSHFQTEATAFFLGADAPFFLLSESRTKYIQPSHSCDVAFVHSLRGPPQAYFFQS